MKTLEHASDRKSIYLGKISTSGSTDVENLHSSKKGFLVLMYMDLL